MNVGELSQAEDFLNESIWNKGPLSKNPFSPSLSIPLHQEKTSTANQGTGWLSHTTFQGITTTIRTDSENIK